MQAPVTRVDAEDDDLAQLVAAIRARGKERALPHPRPEAVAAVLAHLRDEQPLCAEEWAEYERQRRAVEEELRAMDRADEQRDRLL